MLAQLLLNSNQAPKQTADTTATQMKGDHDESQTIDFAELGEFNLWVEKNLKYAVMNTYATTETLREEAQFNNGTVDYSEQAIENGI